VQLLEIEFLNFENQYSIQANIKFFQHTFNFAKKKYHCQHKCLIFQLNFYLSIQPLNLPNK
jgi:hypothetical protein